jgi:hypothetical protein
MNDKAYAGVLALVCLALAFLTSCSSSSAPPPPPVVVITATSGGMQSVAAGQPFPEPLVASVTSNGSPATSGTVTFTAPQDTSGTFANRQATETDPITNGIATSSVFTALPSNADAGTYTVTATTSGATTPASFSLTNLTLNTYVLYVSGQDGFGGDGALNYCAAVAALLIDGSGDVLGGEEDYVDAVGATSPGEETGTPDTISATPKALVVDATTGVGTLTITSSNTNVGVKGVQTFAVQFVNSNHALIAEFDGFATSSGSLDLQTKTIYGNIGNFAFSMHGVNPSHDSVAFGGVYYDSGHYITGTIDTNDATGGVLTNQPLAATSTKQDNFGRSVVTGVTDPAYGNALSIVSYTVGQFAVRLIDVNDVAAWGAATNDVAIGSAYGQGINGTGASAASLGGSVFTLLGQWSEQYASVGQFTTDGVVNLTGTADDNELDNSVQLLNSSIVGAYSTASNGYGGISITGDGNVTTLGLYLTSPTVNINDPNDTTTDLGGALVVDLDPGLPGGMGVITPQPTAPTVAEFAGNYAAGFQNFNSLSGVACAPLCEFDMVGPFTNSTAGLLSTASAEDSDPFDTISGLESKGDSYSSTPVSVSVGYFSMQDSNVPKNPLAATIDHSAVNFNADIYQASATTLYWINTASDSVFLGSIVQQGDLSSMPAAKRPAAKTQPNKATKKRLKGRGWPSTSPPSSTSPSPAGSD